MRILNTVLIVVAVAFSLGNLISAGHGLARWALSVPFLGEALISIAGDRLYLLTLFMMVAIVIVVVAVVRKAVRLVADARRKV